MQLITFFIAEMNVYYINIKETGSLIKAKLGGKEKRKIICAEFTLSFCLFSLSLRLKMLPSNRDESVQEKHEGNISEVRERVKPQEERTKFQSLQEGER